MRVRSAWLTSACAAGESRTAAVAAPASAMRCRLFIPVKVAILLGRDKASDGGVMDVERNARETGSVAGTTGEQQDVTGGSPDVGQGGTMRSIRPAAIALALVLAVPG